MVSRRPSPWSAGQGRDIRPQVLLAALISLSPKWAKSDRRRLPMGPFRTGPVVAKTDEEPSFT
jgi:hypothetical protein